LQPTSSDGRTPYLDTPEQWDKVVAACYQRGIIGCDTETYGHNVKESTPAFRAKIDVWSLALATTQVHPRGYHIARACVMPLEAALYPPMKDMLESQQVLHVFHHAHHDQHSFANHGINLGLVYDTLDAVRLLWPGKDEGYTLKSLRVWLLGKELRESFKMKKHKDGSFEAGLTDPQEINELYTREVKVCSCGKEGCRLTEKKWGPAHAKEFISETRTRVVKVPCPIESIKPGHVRWQRKRDYAGDDAADGLELYELVTQRILSLDSSLPALPW
jgi:hypothetical protein